MDTQTASDVATSTTPGRDAVQLTDFSSEVDLLTVFGAYARKIVVDDVGSGALNVTCIGVAGVAVNRSYTVTAGWSEVLAVTKIRTGTNVARLRVVF